MVNPLGFLCDAFIFRRRLGCLSPATRLQEAKGRGGGILNPATSQCLSNILSLNLNMEFGHHIFDTLSNIVYDSISSEPEKKPR